MPSGMPLKNELVHEVFKKDYFPKNFKSSLMSAGMVTPDSLCLHSCSFRCENKVNDAGNYSH